MSVRRSSGFVGARRVRPSVSAYVASTLALVALTALAVAAPAAAAEGPPLNSSLPVVFASSTTLKENDVITASPGTWTGAAPIYYTYRWLRCTGPTFDTCAPIPDAKAPTYRLAAADVGRGLVMQVKATNPAGSKFAISSRTPSNISTDLRLALPPTISGTPVVGKVLTADPGTWVSGTTISFTYQWTTCVAGGSGCSPIPGAKGRSYTPTLDHAGRQLFVQIKAVSGKTIFANSVRTAAVAAESASGALAVSAVSLPNRLLISGVQFQPSAISSRTPFTARYRVTDSAGKPVSGALVYVLAIPYSWAGRMQEVATDDSGWATVTVAPTALLPLERGRSLVLFVRARKPGEPLLAGVSARRLTQIGVETDRRLLDELRRWRACRVRGHGGADRPGRASEQARDLRREVRAEVDRVACTVRRPFPRHHNGG